MTISHDSRDSFAHRLQRLMDAKGFNQTSLAAKSGIDRSVINRILKGTRHPKPFEIGVLARCFDVSPDELMAGLQLPPQVQQAVDKDREQTERVLAAETARDEATARSEQLAAEVARLQATLERERADTREVHERSEAAWKARLAKAEAAHASQQKTSSMTIRVLKTKLDHTSIKVRAHEAALVTLRQHLSSLQQQLAKERSAKASASVLGGLIGMAIGRTMD